MKVSAIHLLLCLSLTLSATASAEEKPPNVVFIFADDLGYGDLSCYGATKVQTPNIDKLATEGRRFTDAHSASAVCTPSRYGLLTGEYPFRGKGGAGIWGPCSHSQSLLIDTDKLTLGQLFKDKGYATAAIGKWHLGFGEGKTNWNKPLRPGPQDLGFDYFFGVPKVNSGFPYVYVENDSIVGYDPNDPITFAAPYSKTTTYPEAAGKKTVNKVGGAKKAHAIYDDEKTGTLLTKKAVSWIEKNKEEPFFLYFPTTNIHHPFTPAPQFKGTSQAGLYGDFIHEFDWMVGELVKCLDKNGLTENTLFIVTSDNGGMFNRGGQDAFKDGHRINADLLGFKFGVWEGGHRVPFIAKWPGKIEENTVSDQLISNVDMLATFAALTGQTVEEKQLADSINVLPALIDEPSTPLRESLVLCPNKPSHLSLRKNKWLYIPAQGSGGFKGKPGSHGAGGPASISHVGNENSDIENGKIKKDAPPAQLYDLEADVNQTKNLYHEHPEVVKELAAELKTIRPKRSAAPKRQRKKQAAAPPENKPARDATTKPNFVIIFADDLGYGDISCYNPKAAKTPHLDKLASDGFRSTDFFIPANVCSPSRAALLTGRYPMRCGLPVARNENHPKYKNYGFAPEELTIPELLEPAGYRSLMVGKWHLGMEIEGSHPIDAGFEQHLGIPSNYEKKRGSGHSTLYRGKNIEATKVPFEELTKRYTDEVVSFIADQKDEPFLIFFSHHIPHTPHLPSANFKGKSGKGKYGDVIQELDHSTGRVMKALRDAGLDDNTLVVFTSDNGPGGAGSTGGMNGGKFNTMEGGHRVPGIFRWPKQIASNQVSNVTLTSMDLLPLFCDLAGAEQPGDRKIDGKEILPILQDKETTTPHKLLYYYNGTNLQAVREGDWKLHLPRTKDDQPFWNKKPGGNRPYVNLKQPLLFNLKSDLAEKENIAEQNPEIVARLQKHAKEIRKELGDVRVKGSDQRAINLEEPQVR